MRIKVDRDICAGHALCEGYAPDLFNVSAIDGISVPFDGEVPADRIDAARSAEAACPGRAITLEG